MPVILLGTLDTKGTEFRYVRDLLRAHRLETLTIDAGVQGEPAFPPDIPREALFAAAGTELDAVQKAGDRGQAVDAAARGAVALVTRLYEEGRVDGILSLGGSAGTTIGTAAMRALPFGIPKVMVSTLASGQVRQYVGVRDIAMFHSVVDISGLNRISRTVLANAARAMIGMVADRPPVVNTAPDRPLVAASMFGVTTPCVEACRTRLESAGFEVLVFHATGTGGMTLESFAEDGLLEGVLDLTTTELADELVGGILSAGPNRLMSAGRRGIPQVISVGALDMVNFGPVETIAPKFSNRRFHRHNASVTLMRTTSEENAQLGRQVAERANASRGPVTVVLPLRGVSAIDAEGKPFWWPEADAALFESLRRTLKPSVRLLEIDAHINEPVVAEKATRAFLEMLTVL